MACIGFLIREYYPAIFVSYIVFCYLNLSRRKNFLGSNFQKMFMHKISADYGVCFYKGIFLIYFVIEFSGILFFR